MSTRANSILFGAAVVMALGGLAMAIVGRAV